MRTPRTPTRALLLGLLASIHAPPAQGGGQGRGLPPPSFAVARDDRLLALELTQSRDGAPAPRWTRVGTSPREACVAPWTTEVEGSATADCDEDPDSCVCRQVGPGFWLCEPYAYQYTFPLVDAGAPATPCRVEPIAGALFEARAILTPSSEERGDVSTDYVPGPSCSCDPQLPASECCCGKTVDRRAVALDFALQVARENGWSLVDRRSFPSPEHEQLFDLVSQDDLFCSEPILVDEAGWFDGNGFLCSEELVLVDGRYFWLEKIAAGDSIGGMPREHLIQLAQEERPDLLCQPDLAGRCTFTPALALVDPGGALSLASCGDPWTWEFGLPFAEPLTACNDGIDNDGDGDTDLADERDCLSLRSPSEDLFSLPLYVGADALLDTGDADADGDLDIIAATPGIFADESWWIVWYENRLAQHLGWQRHGENELFYPTNTFDPVDDPIGAWDVDGDGDDDVVVNKFYGVGAVWLENRPPDILDWVRREITTAGFVETLADLDRDGDLDAIGKDDSSRRIWLENAGSESAWTQHLVGQLDTQIDTVGDLDEDGDLDLVASDGSVQLWYENRIDDGEPWDAHLIGSSLSSDSDRQISSLDVDGDGDRDLIGGDTVPARLVWLENESQPSWNAHDIQTGAGFEAAADLDGDGDPDVVALSGGDRVWFENRVSTGEGWSPRTFLPAESAGGLLREVADLDVDGDLDLLLDLDGRVEYLVNPLAEGGDWKRRVAGPVPPLFHLLGLYPELQWPRLADLDGDGAPELLASGRVAPGDDAQSIEPYRHVYQLHRLHNFARPPGDAWQRAHPLPDAEQAGTLLHARSDVEASCSAESFGDVWYYFTANEDGVLHVDTCGSYAASGVDTVLSAHRAQPGSLGEELACVAGRPLASPACATRDPELALRLGIGETVAIRVGASHESSDRRFHLDSAFEPVDACAPNPCANGGICTDAVSGYSCSCPPGFTGVDCEMTVPEPGAAALGVVALGALAVAARRARRPPVSASM